MIRNQQIVVAVLNWGIGHATRTIPIVQSLLRNQNQITIASDGAALALFNRIFPELPILKLPGYNISYPSSSMEWNMAIQLPKILKTIRSEKDILTDFCKRNKTDIIISDNRYGCYSSETKNIFISHQLNLQLPKFSALINKLHARLINRFDEVWIPDFRDNPLSGELSNTQYLNPQIKVVHLGAQSRLAKQKQDKLYDLAIVLSGPEPQRSYLEKTVVDQLKDKRRSVILIRGSGKSSDSINYGNIEVIDFADSSLLSKIIAQSSFLLCRSGYSTIMDLHKVGGKVMFVPTPGQTEQLYLASKFKEEGIAGFQLQKDLDIEKGLRDGNQYSGFI